MLYTQLCSLCGMLPSFPKLSYFALCPWKLMDLSKVRNPRKVSREYWNFSRRWGHHFRVESKLMFALRTENWISSLMERYQSLWMEYPQKWAINYYFPPWRNFSQCLNMDMQSRQAACQMIYLERFAKQRLSQEKRVYSDYFAASILKNWWIKDHSLGINLSIISNGVVLYAKCWAK